MDTMEIRAALEQLNAVYAVQTGKLVEQVLMLRQVERDLKRKKRRKKDTVGVMADMLKTLK
jgi:hypothetical protein